eukprot:g4163.t1
MNTGAPYKIMNAIDDQFSTNYSDNYIANGPVEFFDVYSPLISTEYGEVYWKMMDPVELPAEIVERFNGKVMAIVGYEQDQIGYDPVAKKDTIPIKINHAYNHHYIIYLSSEGKFVKFVEVDATEEESRRMHNKERIVKPIPILEYDEKAQSMVEVNAEKKLPGIPTSQMFSEGNGGESRGSFHGYPDNYAQFLQSPKTLRVCPMQIDTWNRNTTLTDSFVPGPLPKASAAPKDAIYSGILECPCTDRIVKVSKPQYATVTTKAGCGSVIEGKLIPTASECFKAAAEVVRNSGNHDPGSVTNSTFVSNELYPAGCSLEMNVNSTASGNGKNPIGITRFNSMPEGKLGAQCGGSMKHAGVASVKNTGISAHIEIDLTPSKTANLNAVQLTISGPSSVWFGVGLDAQAMSDLPNVIIVEGDGSVSERKLGNHDPGTLISSQFKVLSNTVKGEVRTVVLHRGLVGSTSDHYTFSEKSVSSGLFNIIGAVGNGSKYAFHKAASPATISLVALGGNNCICETAPLQQIGDPLLGGMQNFAKNCLPEPFADLKRLNNTICTLEQYKGGLFCCKHGNKLVDKDQTAESWPGVKLNYRLKFRFWFQEVQNINPTTKVRTAVDINNPLIREQASHQDLPRLFQETEAWAGEYAIPQCPAGTPPDQCKYVITSHFHPIDVIDKNWAGVDLIKGGWDGVDSLSLIYLSGHCHAPSCISMTLINSDTGMVLCDIKPIYGNNDKERFDEAGYVAIPPCLTSQHGQPGLPEPIILQKNANLTSIKVNNATYAHHGEMAMWQMRAVVGLKEEESSSTLVIK